MQVGTARVGTIAVVATVIDHCLPLDGNVVNLDVDQQGINHQAGTKEEKTHACHDSRSLRKVCSAWKPTMFLVQ